MREMAHTDIQSPHLKALRVGERIPVLEEFAFLKTKTPLKSAARP